MSKTVHLAELSTATLNKLWYTDLVLNCMRYQERRCPMNNLRFSPNSVLQKKDRSTFHEDGYRVIDC